MRKFVLGLGSIAAVAAPVATVVACGDSDDKATFQVGGAVTADQLTISVLVSGKMVEADVLAAVKKVAVTKSGESAAFHKVMVVFTDVAGHATVTTPTNRTSGTAGAETAATTAFNLAKAAMSSVPQLANCFG